MVNKENIKQAARNSIVTIGRIKENINIGAKVYKLQNKKLLEDVFPTYKEDKEFKKIPLDCKISVLENKPISLEITCNNNEFIYYKETLKIVSDIIPIKATNSPITSEKIKEQLSKTGNTQFTFENINIELDDNLFVSKFSIFNELRRLAIEKLQNQIIAKHITNRNLLYLPITKNTFTKKTLPINISLLLNILDNRFNYTTLYDISKIYIPLKYFLDLKYYDTILKICQKFNTYIYMPNIIRNTTKINFNNIIEKFKIKGFIISNISQIEILKKYNLELIGNYTLNAYNSYTIESFKNLCTFSSFCITPELNNFDTKELINSCNSIFELLVYGKIPFMTMNYCLIGNSNKCYKDCKKLCTTKNKFYLKDRIGLKFRVIPDNNSTITTIYNSKTTSYDYSEFVISTARISIIDENIEQIQNIINNVKLYKRFEGKDFSRTF